MSRVPPAGRGRHCGGRRATARRPARESRGRAHGAPRGGRSERAAANLPTFTVIGSAGIGKSRLVTELLHQIDGRFRPLRGRCLPYGEAITFWPVSGIVGEAGGEEALAHCSPASTTGSASPNSSAPRSGQVDGAAAAEETFWAIRRFIEELARDRPLVVCLDDVHWASPTLLDLIEYLAGWMRDAPVLLLVLARPELFELRSELGHAAAERNGPAAGAARRRAIRPLLAAPGRAASSCQPIRTSELSARQRGIRSSSSRWSRWRPRLVELPATLRMPPTIQALLAERLGPTLDPERLLLERASVIGKEFLYRAVIDLSRRTTAATQRATSSPSSARTSCGRSSLTGAGTCLRSGTT